MENLKILGISGGKKGGKTSGFLVNCLEAAEKLGAKTNLVELANYNILPISKVFENPELDKSLQVNKDDCDEVIKKILEADGIVFATPTHWFGPSSEMKILIDRLTPLENAGFLLEGKVAGFITYGNEEGRMNTLMNLAAIVNHQGMIIPPYALIYLTDHKNDWAKKDILLLAKNMVNLIKALKETKIHFDYE